MGNKVGCSSIKAQEQNLGELGVFSELTSEGCFEVRVFKEVDLLAAHQGDQSGSLRQEIFGGGLGIMHRGQVRGGR